MSCSHTNTSQFSPHLRSTLPRAKTIHSSQTKHILSALTLNQTMNQFYDIYIIHLSKRRFPCYFYPATIMDSKVLIPLTFQERTLFMMEVKVPSSLGSSKIPQPGLSSSTLVKGPNLLPSKKRLMSGVRTCATDGRSSLYSSSSSSSSGSVAGVRAQPPLPKHVSVIFDGNRTWCKSKGIPITYKPLCDASVVLAQLCAKWGIPFASSLFFMSDNWRRSKEWQDLILEDFRQYLEDNLEVFMRSNIRVSIIGEKSKLPRPLIEVIRHVEDTTINNIGVDLIFAVSYGGRTDIIQATRKICEKVKFGLIKSEDINEALFEKELWTNINGRVAIPNPDLLIRVGGPTRLSNHMLWQMAYTELYFNEGIHAPDFDEEEFRKALSSFQNRNRKFGL